MISAVRSSMKEIGGASNQTAAQVPFDQEKEEDGVYQAETEV